MSGQVVLNQFIKIDVFLIVSVCSSLFILLPCKLLHVCLRNEFLIKTSIIIIIITIIIITIIIIIIIKLELPLRY